MTVSEPLLPNHLHLHALRVVHMKFNLPFLIALVVLLLLALQLRVSAITASPAPVNHALHLQAFQLVQETP
jgi:hypothetical protein